MKEDWRIEELSDEEPQLEYADQLHSCQSEIALNDNDQITGFGDPDGVDETRQETDFLTRLNAAESRGGIA